MKDAYYFSHDSNAQDDPKCMVLIDQLGMEGYGIFWALIEKLRAEKDYRLPLLVCQSFARRWGTSKEKVEAVVLNFSLFKIDNNTYFYSERLKSAMEIKSAKARESVNNRWKNTNKIRAYTNEIRNDTIKGKERKGKESKEITFNFGKELENLGVEMNIILDWLKVRKAKKAVNTQTAFEAIKKEIKLSGLTANECIKIAVERNWCGFKRDWLPQTNIVKSHETSFPQ